MLGKRPAARSRAMSASVPSVRAKAVSASVAPMNVTLIVTGQKGEKRARFGESLLDAKFEIQTYVAHGGMPPAGGPGSAKPTTQGNP